MIPRSRSSAIACRTVVYATPYSSAKLRSLGSFARDLALGDPPLDVVRYLDIGIFSPKGINRTSGHKINLGCSLSCQNTS